MNAKDIGRTLTIRYADGHVVSVQGAATIAEAVEQAAYGQALLEALAKAVRERVMWSPRSLRGASW